MGWTSLFLNPPNHDSAGGGSQYILIKCICPWGTANAVEYAVLEWVDWFNHRRLLGPLGHIPPVEAETDHYSANDPAGSPAGVTSQALR